MLSATWGHIIQAFKVDRLLFASAYRDPGLNWSAARVLAVVVLSHFITHVSLEVIYSAPGQPLFRNTSAIVLAIYATLEPVIAWAIWLGISYLVGTRGFGGSGNIGGLARSLAFAQGPQVLAVLGIIPGVSQLLDYVLFFYTIYLAFVAIGQALSLEDSRAFLTMVAAGVVVFLLLTLGELPRWLIRLTLLLANSPGAV